MRSAFETIPFTLGWKVLGILLCALGAIGSMLSHAEASEVEVEIGQGTLVGTTDEGVRRFLGVPFAAPPIGPLRFRAPREPEPWSGERDARRFAPVCPQAKIGAGPLEVVGDEDCLYLNVYTPDVAGANRPVLVWIHGGGRRVGDARRDVSAFVRETQTVVVTIQYRLSYLAFLAHPALTAEDPTRLASGNYGFQDAVTALRWVRSEIAAFGGDPRRVSIGGLSGGGTMVCGLLVSPRAAGLFDAAIVQSSGGCWFPTDAIELAEARGQKAADALGCSDQPDVAACLRGQSVAALFEKLGRDVDSPFSPGSAEYFAALPILGGRTGHLVDGHVFPRSWPQAFHSGAFHHVPVMIGVTEHEGRRIYAELLYNMGWQSFGDEDYVRALHGLTGSREIAEAAARRFPLDAADGSPAEVFADVGTHAHYTCPHAELASALARTVPTWLYEFRVPGPRKSQRIELGAYHGADTEILFGAGSADPPRRLEPAQQRAAQTLRGYVANFLKSGDPNGNDLPQWPQHSERTGAQHLQFDDQPRAAKGLREASCRFWRERSWDALPTF